MSSFTDERFLAWLEALERRHLADLSLPEIRRALQALSARYIAGRGELCRALQGRGKRAAFALFYAPLHFLTLAQIVERLQPALGEPQRILELGCGSGAASAAWALATTRRPTLSGVDLNPWVLGEARWNWKQLGLSGRTHRGDLLRTPLPEGRNAILAAYTLNELTDEARASLLPRLLGAARQGSTILVVEPIARRLTPWWPAWSSAFESAGGHAAEWRFKVQLPAPLSTLDRAARLDHSELTARSLFIPPVR